MRLVILGAPGAGKGTQAEALTAKLGVPAISMGNILRAAIKHGTPLGLEAKAYVDAGQLVPDDVIIGVIKERMAQPDCAAGYILDGMPRTIAQAEAMEENGIEAEAAIALVTEDDVIVERLSNRRICQDCGATYHLVTIPPKTEGVCDKCGADIVLRHDDEPETVKNRLKIYHEETELLVGFYETRGKLKLISGVTGIEETTEAVFKALGI